MASESTPSLLPPNTSLEAVHALFSKPHTDVRTRAERCFVYACDVVRKSSYGKVSAPPRPTPPPNRAAYLRPRRPPLVVKAVPRRVLLFSDVLVVAKAGPKGALQMKQVVDLSVAAISEGPRGKAAGLDEADPFYHSFRVTSEDKHFVFGVRSRADVRAWVDRLKQCADIAMDARTARLAAAQAAAADSGSDDDGDGDAAAPAPPLRSASSRGAPSRSASGVTSSASAGPSAAATPVQQQASDDLPPHFMRCFNTDARPGDTVLVEKTGEVRTVVTAEAGAGSGGAAGTPLLLLRGAGGATSRVTRDAARVLYRGESGVHLNISAARGTSGPAQAGAASFRREPKTIPPAWRHYCVPGSLHAIAYTNDVEALVDALEARRAPAGDVPGGMDERDQDGLTPVQVAAAAGSVDVLALLMNHGASMSDTAAGESALHLAARNSWPQAVEYVLALGANPDAEDLLGHTPLWYAAHAPPRLDAHPDPVAACVRLLCEAGASTDLCDASGVPLLHSLARMNLPEALRALVDSGASLITISPEGGPLHAAARYGSHAALKLLLERGANAHARDAAGRTPLHVAGSLEAAAMLAAHGARLDAKDGEGRAAGAVRPPGARPSDDCAAALRAARAAWTGGARSAVGDSDRVAGDGDWIGDEDSAECLLCGASFGLLNRRHHCRCCGVLCCAACSGKRFVRPSTRQEYRACDGCYSRLRHTVPRSDLDELLADPGEQALLEADSRTAMTAATAAVVAQSAGQSAAAARAKLLAQQERLAEVASKAGQLRDEAEEFHGHAREAKRQLR